LTPFHAKQNTLLFSFVYSRKLMKNVLQISKHFASFLA
jgi:hypothetical protein